MQNTIGAVNTWVDFVLSRVKGDDGKEARQKFMREIAIIRVLTAIEHDTRPELLINCADDRLLPEEALTVFSQLGEWLEQEASFNPQTALRASD